MATQSLAGYLASRVGGSLRSDAGKTQAAGQMGEALRLSALAQHLNACQQDFERPSPSVLARR